MKTIKKPFSINRIAAMLLFCTIICFGEIGFAQTFAPVGTKWYVRKISDGQLYKNESIKDTIVQFLPCTIVDGVHGKRIFAESQDSVYYLFNDQFYPIYILNPTVGDSIETYFLTTCMVNLAWKDTMIACKYKIDSIQTQNVFKKYYISIKYPAQIPEFEENENIQPRYYVENYGMGYSEYADILVPVLYCHPVPASVIYLEACFEYNNVMYDARNKFVTKNDCATTDLISNNEAGTSSGYPNPVLSSFRLTLPSSSEIQQVKVYDSNGKGYEVPYVLENGELAVPAHSLNSGQYFVKCTDASQSYVFKFVKQ